MPKKRRNTGPKTNSYVDVTVKSRKTGEVDKKATERVRTKTSQFNMRQMGRGNKYTHEELDSKPYFFGGSDVKKAVKMSEARRKREDRRRGK